MKLNKEKRKGFESNEKGKEPKGSGQIAKKLHVKQRAQNIRKRKQLYLDRAAKLGFIINRKINV